MGGVWGEIINIFLELGSRDKVQDCVQCGSSCRLREGGARGKKSQRGEGKVTSDPADRLILSFQQPPLSLLFTSLKECRGEVKRADRTNEASPGGDEREEKQEEKAEARGDK